MSEILPEGEEIRKAVRWISEKRKEKEAPPLNKLLEEAGMRFNLSPADTEFLRRFLRKQREHKAP
jgi:hypothetical protein